MRLTARRLRPGDLGSGPIGFGLAAHGKARRRDDQRLPFVATSKGAHLVGSGAGSDKRLISSMCKQHRMIAAVCQQGRDDGQFDTAIGPILEHVEHRGAAVSLQ